MNTRLIAACRNKANISSLLIIFALLPFLVNAAAKKEVPFKKGPVVVQASDLLPKELLEDPGYTIAPEVAVHFHRAVYQLDTPYGPSTVYGTPKMLERIDELKAIERLEEMKKTSVYKDAVKKSAKGPLRTARGMLTAPVDTVSRVGRGIGNFFSDIGSSIISDNPYQENVAKTALGFATAKRQLAHELGVNPYSDYEPLQEQLNTVAWTSVGGGMTVLAGFAAIPGTAGTVMSTTRTASSMKQLVRDSSVRELKNINTKKLKAMGVEDAMADAFIRNYYYNPEEATRLVGAMDSMKGVADRSEFFKRATLVDTPAEAHMMREWAELLASYHLNIEPVEGLVTVSTAPFLRRKDGSFVGIFPTDYSFWTSQTDSRIQQINEEFRAKGFKPGGELWLDGKADADFKEAVEAMGWKVKAQVGPLLFR